MYIYIYISADAPQTPNVTGYTAKEGSNMTLTCFAGSLSLPAEFRNLSLIEYKWTGDYSGTGNSLVIGVVDRNDNGNTVTCTAKDQGAGDHLSSPTTVNLNVQCEYCMQHIHIIKSMLSSLCDAILAYFLGSVTLAGSNTETEDH